MDWTAQIDSYCERLDLSFWAEPVNALTNAAFLIAAVVMAARLRGTGLALGWALVMVLAAIGAGSFLFHTYATRWAAVADVAPILGFILVYLFAICRDIWRLPALWSGAAVLAFLPYSIGLTMALSQLGWLGGSAGYVPVLVLIALHAPLLWARAPDLARGFAIGAGILALSLTARTVDLPLCASIPLGTHFLWHCLNALMLGWMIEIYRRHMLAAGPQQG